MGNGKLVQMIARYQASQKCHCSWSRKGTSLSESQNVKIFHERINSDSYEYRVEIMKPTQDKAGLYRCQVKNNYGQMQVYLKLNIESKPDLTKRKTKEAPTFVDMPKIISLNNGKLVQMIARYEASDKCYCTWSKKGVPVFEKDNVKIFHEKINARSYEYRVEM